MLLLASSMTAFVSLLANWRLTCAEACISAHRVFLVLFFHKRGRPTRAPKTEQAFLMRVWFVLVTSSGYYSHASVGTYFKQKEYLLKHVSE